MPTNYPNYNRIVLNAEDSGFQLIDAMSTDTAVPLCEYTNRSIGIVISL